MATTPSSAQPQDRGQDGPEPHRHQRHGVLRRRHRRQPHRHHVTGATSGWPTGNAGVIVVEALTVVDENRGRLHQLTALPQNQKGLTDLVRAMRKENPKPLISGSSPTRESSPAPSSRSGSA